MKETNRNVTVRKIVTTFGERLRSRRQDLGMSQTDIADSIMVSQKQVSRYESDSSEPTAEVISRLAMALGVSADWLLGLAHRVGGSELTDQERAMIMLLRRLGPERRALLEDIVEVFAHEEKNTAMGTKAN